MKLIPFVDFSTYNSANQFGQYDPTFYPVTKHHIGSDFKVPVRTRAIAPEKGEMVKAYVSLAKGNVGIFVFTYEGREWGLELCHLAELPMCTTYERGEPMALTGNTGSATTGAHLHAVMHRDAFVTKNYEALISEQAYVKLWREGRIVDTYLWFFQRM